MPADIELQRGEGADMRYYHYGEKKATQELETEEKEFSGMAEKAGRFGELIIDEDTIYEIDEECIRCKKEK